MPEKGYSFTQISIMDIAGKCHYQKANPMAFSPAWAEYDQTKPWFVRLPGENNTSNGAISMESIDNNPLNMTANASFNDLQTGTPCALQLSLFQQGAPLMVWGTGTQLVDPAAPTPISQYNYYYSLTHLQASGTITIGTEVFEVTGLTWMDHEYGAFPSGSPGKPVIWMLQDIQFENGLHLSNYTPFGIIPQEGVAIQSRATLLYNDESYFIDTITTPMAPTFKSKKNITYYLKFLIKIENSNISFMVDSLFPNQLFLDETADIWEGIGKAEMSIMLSKKIKIPLSSGPAWIEQNLG
jgi:predicted secreted hydrolase